MRRTRLVIVEGIMGTGKSMTARYLVGQLGRRRIPAEGFGNPGKWGTRPPDVLRGELRRLSDRRIVWDRLDPETLMERSVEAWRAFVERALREEAVSVFDGRFFNGDFAGLVMMDVAPERLRAHARRIARVAAPLEPCIVYLHPGDAGRGLRRIARKRGRRWEASQVGWKTASPLARRRGLEGREGWIELYRTYLELSLDVLDELELPSTREDVSGGDWEAVHARALEFLELAPVPDPGYRLWLWSKTPRIWLTRVLGNLTRPRRNPGGSACASV